jgi:glycosyltransferase involved in cell wall biosynthesis
MIQEDIMATFLISIITATYNAELNLTRLVESLKAQTDSDFEWIVCDGGSIDGTLKIVNESKTVLRSVVLSSASDFGIYDALNRGIKISKGSYYLVLGADDWLDPDCIKNFKQSVIESDADIHTASILCENGAEILKPRNYLWLNGMGAILTGHSVGSIFKKTLHDTNGLYTNKYPIAADCYFVLNAFKTGAKINHCKFLSGYFGQSGVSSTDSIGAICELYRVHVALGMGKLLQTLILFVRLTRQVLL